MHVSWAENTRLAFQTTEPLLVISSKGIPGTDRTEDVAMLVTVEKPYFYARSSAEPWLWPDPQPLRLVRAKRDATGPLQVRVVAVSNKQKDL